MALGLNGHLKNLSYMNLHDYLCKVRGTLCYNTAYYMTEIITSLYLDRAGQFTVNLHIQCKLMRALS